MAVMIKSLEIEAFRGISLKKDINFSTDEKQTCCTLFVGDNGSGKSSIIDAIEFVAQGRIHNTQSLSTKSKVEAFNKFTNKKPSIKIILNNGIEFKRVIDIDVEGKPKVDRSVLSQFRIAPFVFRRNNILRFWTTEETKRQVLFFNYNLYNDSLNKNVNSLGDSFIERIKELEEERLAEKQKRREARGAIAQLKNIDEENIPLTKNEFYLWIRENLFKGMSLGDIDKARKRGIKISLQPKIENAARQIISRNKKIQDIDTEINRYRPKTTLTSTSKNIISNIFHELSHAITDTFLTLTTLVDEIDRIKMKIGEESEVSLSFDIYLKNGEIVAPEKILSEANLDMLAFVIFLEMTKKAVEFGQAPVLILDDVFQSIDSGIRLKIIQNIFENLKGWQIIITVHDRLWKEQLIELLNINNIKIDVYEIFNWKSDIGIKINSDSMLLDQTLEKNIESGSINEIISNASILLEKICSNLSFNLPISVTRRKNDKYTLGDLWPGIAKELKKTNINVIVEKLGKLIYLRNMIGGHYNEWALSLTRNEAVEFAMTILEFYNNVYCNSCGHWIQDVVIAGKKIARSCRCKKIYIE
jgi:energy-coupling factor transporter ATP-binding protein EcfA2